VKAIVQDRYGGPEVLHLADVPKPVAAADEVLVRVRTVALNAYDKYLMRGRPGLLRLMGIGFRRPKQAIRGIDLAGVVDSVGASVTGFSAGDEVFGHAGACLTEYTTVAPKHLLAKPQRLSFAQAAALSTAGITALRGVRDNGKAAPGRLVLINGAGGGVGTFAVQIAKALGARVTAVTGPSTVDLVRSLGADDVIDYSKEDFTRRPERYDVLVDISGNRPVADVRRVLNPEGLLVVVGGGNDGR